MTARSLSLARHIAPLFLLLPACASLSGGPRAVTEYDAATFFDTISLAGASFSPDATRLLYTSDESGVFNVYARPAAGGPATRLTQSDTDAVFSLGYFPDDERFLCTSDQGGNELNHVFVRELDGTLVDLTAGENLKAQFVGWRADGAAFWITTNERDPKFFDLYEHSTEPGYARRLVFENPGGYDVSEVSRDGRWVALTKVRNNADSDVYVHDTRNPTAEPLHVTPHTGDVSHGVVSFTPESDALYYSSNEGSEFDRVWSFTPSSAERELVVAADWDVSSVYFSYDGRYRVTAVNADARTDVSVMEVASGAELALPPLPRGDLRNVTFARDSSAMAFYVNGDTSPSNLYVLDLADLRLTALTDSLSPEIARADLVESEVIRYPSFDGLDIPALLYRPHPASATQPVPALVLVHGGPGGQSRTGYNPMIQHLVNHGYAVLAVNNRGSSGYGKTFFHLDDQRHGDVDLADCIYGRRYLEGLEWVDGERIGIMGGSYGGYMVAAALAFEPEAFEVGVDIFGVTNWLRTLESIPPWWEDFREALYAELGDPVADKERLTAISPLFHADKIRRPLLVVQGANDPRVLQAESDEIVAAVRENGVPVEYVVFEDEGHGFRSRENRITASEAYLSFLEQYLGDAAPRP